MVLSVDLSVWKVTWNGWVQSGKREGDVDTLECIEQQKSNIPQTALLIAWPALTLRKGPQYLLVTGASWLPWLHMAVEPGGEME